MYFSCIHFLVQFCTKIQLYPFFSTILYQGGKHAQRRKTCPAPKICQQSSLVYKAMCQLCHNAYIGMTTRRLHVRAREHMNSAKQYYPDSAFGEHYREEHPQEAQTLSLRFSSDVLTTSAFTSKRQWQSSSSAQA